MAKKRKRDVGKPKTQEPHDDDDSIASRAIDAELDAAMGIDNPDYDWLVEPYK